MCVPCPICIGTAIATVSGLAVVVKKIKKK